MALNRPGCHVPLLTQRRDLSTSHRPRASEKAKSDSRIFARRALSTPECAGQKMKILRVGALRAFPRCVTARTLLFRFARCKILRRCDSRIRPSMLPKMMTHHAVWAKRVRILRLTRFAPCAQFAGETFRRCRRCSIDAHALDAHTPSSRHERLRDPHAGGGVRPKRAEDRYRAFRRRRVPSRPSAGASPRCFLLASTASEKNAFCRSWRHPRRAAIASPARMPPRILSNRKIKAFHRFGSPRYASDVPLPDHPSPT